MKKALVLASITLLSTLFTTHANAIMIINENSKTIKYSIADGTACTINYNNGEISSGGQILWTETLLLHPNTVCVHATGYTSTTGAFAYGVKNDGCILKVKDAGFMRGIKIEKVSGC